MRNRRALYHVFTWAGVYVLWVMIFHSYAVHITKTITVQFCYLVFIMADYYAISLYVIPRYLSVGKHVKFVLSIIALIIISAALRTSAAVYMMTRYFDFGHAPDVKGIYITSLINISAWILIITMFKMLVDRTAVQQKLATLENERISNELNYLKAQINPHSLFNSLNTIYGHIEKQNKTARNILLQFSGLLRYQLYDCNGVSVKLGREIQFIKDYVNFHRLRKDDHIQVKIDIEDVDPELMIAPLLLVVLIENAFKFVSNYGDGQQNVIDINLKTRANQLVFTLYNTCDECLPSFFVNACGGIGIINLKRRLELVYPGQFEFTVNTRKNSYETTLKINLK